MGAEPVTELTGAYFLRQPGQPGQHFVPGDDPLELRWPGPAALAHGDAMARGQRWLDDLERQGEARRVG